MCDGFGGGGAIGQGGLAQSQSGFGGLFNQIPGYQQRMQGWEQRHPNNPLAKFMGGAPGASTPQQPIQPAPAPAQPIAQPLHNYGATAA